MLLSHDWLESHHFVHDFTQRNEDTDCDQYFIFLFLILINRGDGEECGKVKISFFRPRGGKISHNYIKL